MLHDEKIVILNHGRPDQRWESSRAGLVSHHNVVHSGESRVGAKGMWRGLLRPEWPQALTASRGTTSPRPSRRRLRTPHDMRRSMT